MGDAAAAALLAAAGQNGAGNDLKPTQAIRFARRYERKLIALKNACTDGDALDQEFQVGVPDDCEDKALEYTMRISQLTAQITELDTLFEEACKLDEEWSDEISKTKKGREQDQEQQAFNEFITEFDPNATLDKYREVKRALKARGKATEREAGQASRHGGAAITIPTATPHQQQPGAPPLNTTQPMYQSTPFRPNQVGAASHISQFRAATTTPQPAVSNTGTPTAPPPPSTGNQTQSISFRDVPLIQFTGDPWQWDAWRSDFLKRVDSAPYSDLQKLALLQQSVKGAAKSAIRSLTMRDDNYETALEILQRQFGNVQRVRSGIYEKLQEMPPAHYSGRSCRNTFNEIYARIKDL